MKDFKIQVQPNGNNDVFIDGEDVSGHIKGFQLNSKLGQTPTIWLEVTPSGVPFVQGMADVVMLHPGAVTSKFLTTIDAKKVEERALERQEWGDGGSIVQYVLQVIGEIADEAQFGSGAQSGGEPHDGRGNRN